MSLFWPKAGFFGQSRLPRPGKSRLWPGRSRLLARKEPAYTAGSFLWAPRKEAGFLRPKPASFGRKEAGFWPRKKPAYTEPALSRLWPRKPASFRGAQRSVEYVTSSPTSGDSAPERCHIWVLFGRLQAAERGTNLHTLRGAQRKQWSRRKPAFTVFSGKAGSHLLKKPAHTYEWGRLNRANVRFAHVCGLFLTRKDGS